MENYENNEIVETINEEAKTTELTVETGSDGPSAAVLVGVVLAIGTVSIVGYEKVLKPFGKWASNKVKQVFSKPEKVTTVKKPVEASEVIDAEVVNNDKK